MIAATEKQTKRPRIRNNPTALARCKYIHNIFIGISSFLLQLLFGPEHPGLQKFHGICNCWWNMPWGECLDPGAVKQLTMCFLYWSTTIRISGATHVLKLKHLPWSRQSDCFSTSMHVVQLELPLKKEKHWMNTSPAFADPFACTHKALSATPCISKALHMLGICRSRTLWEPQ